MLRGRTIPEGSENPGDLFFPTRVENVQSLSELDFGYKSTRIDSSKVPKDMKARCGLKTCQI